MILTECFIFKHGGWYRKGAYMYVTTHVNNYGMPPGYEYDFGDSEKWVWPSGHIQYKIRVKGWADGTELAK